MSPLPAPKVLCQGSPDISRATGGGWWLRGLGLYPLTGTPEHSLDPPPPAPCHSVTGDSPTAPCHLQEAKLPGARAGRELPPQKPAKKHPQPPEIIIMSPNELRLFLKNNRAVASARRGEEKGPSRSGLPW